MKIDFLDGSGKVLLTNAAGEAMLVSVMEFWEICRYGARMDTLDEVQNYLADADEIAGVDAYDIKNDPAMIDRIVEQLMDDRIRNESGDQVYDAIKACVNASKMISYEMIKTGYEAGHVRLIESPNGDGVACSIGDNWFYFGGSEAEGVTVEEYKKNIPEDTIIKEIFEVLGDFERTGLGWDEYRYYGYYLSEQLKQVAAQEVGWKEYALTEGECASVVGKAVNSIRGFGCDQGSGFYGLRAFELGGEQFNVYCEICKQVDDGVNHYSIYYAVELDEGDTITADWVYTNSDDLDELKKTVFEIASTDFSDDVRPYISGNMSKSVAASPLVKYTVYGVNDMGSTWYLTKKDADSCVLWPGAPKEMRATFDSKEEALQKAAALDERFKWGTTRHFVEEIKVADLDKTVNDLIGDATDRSKAVAGSGNGKEDFMKE